jgi:hypothetical protein
MQTALFMPFGRYAGRTIDSLPGVYLAWLSTLDDVREPLRSAIELEIEKRALLAPKEPAKENPMTDVRARRAALRRAGRGRVPSEIVQQHGVEFIEAFSRHAHLQPTEFLTTARISPRVLRTGILSKPAQRLVAAVARAEAAIFVAAGGIFDDFAAKYPSRAEALRALAEQAFSMLAREVGEAKLEEYRDWLRISGEYVDAPLDLDEN